MSKKVIKDPTNKQKQEAFIDDEYVRVQDLTHGVNRYSNQLLSDKNYFYEGDATGMIGPGTKIPKIEWFTNGLIKNRVSEDRH